MKHEYTDAYNVTYFYLRGKYGRNIGFTNSFRRYLDNRKASERKAAEALATDRDYEWFIQADRIIDHDDKHLYLLLNQYNYGIVAKQELQELVTRLGIN